MSESSNMQTFSDLLRELPMPDYGPDIFLKEMQRELDREREAWTPRQRRAQALRRPYYRAKWWAIENVTWRFARRRPDC